MCLSVPAMIVAFSDNQPPSQATVVIRGNRLLVDISLIDEPLLGDYVLVHAGIAIDKYDLNEALDTLELQSEVERILGDKK